MSETKNRAEVRGGILGSACSLVVFFLSIIVFSICGIRGTKSYWSAGFLSMLATFLVFKDKDRFQEAVVDGIRDRVFVLTLIALYFAGILSKIITAGHLVNGLMWAASEVNLSPAWLPVATFIITAVIATASGTSSGSVATMAPVMLPLCVSMGCSPAIICGAIVSGAYFGDNLAPVSDTTIASAMTQEVSMGKVVKSRMKYSLVGGAVATVLYIIFGIREARAGGMEAMTGDPAYISSLAYIILPILVVVLMARGKNLITSLLHVLDVLGGLIDLQQCAGDALEKHRACRSQLNVPLATDEQLDAQLVLQHLHLAADSGLGDVQLLRRFGDAAVFRHGLKITNIPQLHSQNLPVSFVFP